MKKETEENQQNIQKKGEEIVSTSPIPSVNQEDNIIYPIEDMGERIADQLANVVTMLRKKTISKVSIELDTDGNQKFVIDDSERKYRYTTEVRSLPGVIEKKETLSTRLPREKRLKAVEKLSHENLSQREIAEKLMVSQQTISLDLQKLRGKDH